MNMSKYYDVCERVALAAEALEKAEAAWEACLAEGRLPVEKLGDTVVWHAKATILTEKLAKTRDKFNTALEEFRAYLA